MTQSPASQLFTRYSNEARAAGVQPAMNPALPTNTAPLLPQTAPDSTNSTTIPNVTQSSPIDYRASALPFAPGQLLGQQIAAAPDQRLNTSVNAQVNAVNSNLANITASATAQPGEDVYLDLLRRINLTESTVPQVAQIEPSQSSQQIPSATQPDAAVSVPSVPKPGETPESPNQPSPTANPKVEQLIQKLNYQMPALSTMAGTTESQLNNALARAEKLMAEGKYFIAESTYESALNLRPGYPLAVVGRANAQIGAGMFLSAGNTLHDLFSEHPELIATQYTQPVLPPADRLSIIEDQLTSLINKNSNDPQLPLVLAYIAYQQNRPDLIQHALELMRQRSAADRLIPLLRRLWLDTPTPDRNATSTPPATQP